MRVIRKAFEDEVICPKPRRMGLYCCAPELIKPLYHLQRYSFVLTSQYRFVGKNHRMRMRIKENLRPLEFFSIDITSERLKLLGKTAYRYVLFFRSQVVFISATNLRSIREHRFD